MAGAFLPPSRTDFNANPADVSGTSQKRCLPAAGDLTPIIYGKLWPIGTKAKSHLSLGFEEQLRIKPSSLEQFSPSFFAGGCPRKVELLKSRWSVSHKIVEEVSLQHLRAVSTKKG